MSGIPRACASELCGSVRQAHAWIEYDSAINTKKKKNENK